MTLDLNRLMPDAARAALRAERFEQYEMRAVMFLYQGLGWAVRGMDEAALRRAIGASYALSRAAGLRSESDHLKYLYAAAYWGIGFETDPQYGAPLAEAGFRPATADRAALLPIEPVVRSLGRWQQSLQDELAGANNALRGLVAIADGAPPGPRQLAEQVAAIWPARSHRLGFERLSHCLAAATTAFDAPEAPRNGAAVHAAMALHLGHAFRRDPFLPRFMGVTGDGYAMIAGLIDHWQSFGQAAV